MFTYCFFVVFSGKASFRNYKEVMHPNEKPHTLSLLALTRARIALEAGDGQTLALAEKLITQRLKEIDTHEQLVRVYRGLGVISRHQWQLQASWRWYRLTFRVPNVASPTHLKTLISIFRDK